MGKALGSAYTDPFLTGQWEHKYHFEVSSSYSFESKSSLLDIETSLKASFLGGLVEVGGSAKYLNDNKTSKNQSRVTFEYNATTTFKQLSWSPIQKLDDGLKSLATHVVTGILYGADAFFVFDSEKLALRSDVQNIQGRMEAVMKKIPMFNVDGNVDIQLIEEEKALTNMFSCKFHGDFILESNPATLEDAVKTYVELSKLLIESSENSVPLKTEDALEDVGQMKIKCNDCLAEEAVQLLPQLQTDVISFQKLCNYYTSNIQQMLMKKLPAIREGEEDESSLQQFFEGRKESPFSHEKLSKWLECKEREVNVISSCLKIMEGTRIPNQSELEKVVLDPDVEHVLCYVFTSLESDDPFLDEMTNHLDSQKSSTNEVPWYFSNEVLSQMRRKARSFQDCANKLKPFKQIQFLVASISNETYTGATIYHYKDGILVGEDFPEPDLPAPKTVTNRTDLLLYACDVNVDPLTLSYQLQLTEGNKKSFL
ncbi:LOW QUALITY PROTEIN: neoverrucotoxin subunit alpha-like [Parambassis ranga]|uniref:LOW QUALITY PROTEIN: neoverrucotoxin subunit alpha-like n=1 Tax=Parambassis ranga TaxID=210632 RepID=A0A6P7K9H3_9TELE|nr:LOW QUALITY PROTEIN: neoverrucotoxin subunit alpha-like [Parambassis ranga]